MRSERGAGVDDDEGAFSVDELLLGAEAEDDGDADWSLVVPAAPMLDVPGLVVVVLLLEVELLGVLAVEPVVPVEPVDPVEPVEPLDPIEPVEPLFIWELLCPLLPVLEESELLLVCAIAKPPMASAAAAANVVSVFFVVVMNVAP